MYHATLLTASHTFMTQFKMATVSHLETQFSIRLTMDLVKSCIWLFLI